MEIILATHNLDKCKELQNSLSDSEIKILTLKDFPDISEIIEDGLSLEENAFIKSRTVFNITKIPTISDDTGLFVDALNGAPGIYSARYAGENASDLDNRNKIIDELKVRGLKSLPAYYVCVLVGVHSVGDPMPIFSSGEVHGEVSINSSGEGGFGYDKIFYPSGYKFSMANMDPDEKNEISHRAIASKSFLNKLEDLKTK